MVQCSYLGMHMCVCENNKPLHPAVHTQLWGLGGVRVSGRQRTADGQICKKGFDCAAVVQVSRMSAPWAESDKGCVTGEGKLLVCKPRRRLSFCLGRRRARQRAGRG